MAHEPAKHSALIRTAMDARGYSVADVAANLTERTGRPFTRQHVEAWLAGGGISDATRPALCHVLGIDFLNLSLALAARPAPSPRQAASS